MAAAFFRISADFSPTPPATLCFLSAGGQAPRPSAARARETAATPSLLTPASVASTSTTGSGPLRKTMEKKTLMEMGKPVKKSVE
jgi:hypothetical protein